MPFVRLFSWGAFLVSILKLVRCHVHAFGDVLEQVLHDTDVSDDFDIDVTLVLEQHCWIVWHDPGVVNRHFALRQAFWLRSRRRRVSVVDTQDMNPRRIWSSCRIL